MRRIFQRVVLACGLAVGLAGPAAAGLALRLIGTATIGGKSGIGGLSGIDYDAKNDRWLAISDDRSEHGPARLHALKIDYDQNGVAGATVVGTVPLRRPDGTTYPPADEPDFESLRLDPSGAGIWHTDEGSARKGRSPLIRHAMNDGRFVGDLPVPAMFDFFPGQQSGLRPNLSFEGLAFATDGRSLWLAVEGPLWQDGPPPSAQAGALIRLSRLSRDGGLLAQHAYPLDPVPIAPAAGKLADNGVSEILVLAENHLLVLERSGRQDEVGAWHFTARLYAADCREATDVRAVPALGGANIRVVTKHLVYNFATDGLPRVDNLEGITFGRKLANGHATLVAISDNNFNASQTTQVWVFEFLSDNPI